MGEAIVRFIIGGMFVSVFAILGDLLEPKSFAGLFGAAPSVALATLLLTVHRQGLVCRHRGAFDDRRRDCVLRLCLLRMLCADAL